MGREDAEEDGTAELHIDDQTAEKRKRQRGMEKVLIDLILYLARPRTAGSGATKYELGRSDVARLRHSLDRIANGATVIVAPDGCQIQTVYKKKR